MERRKILLGSGAVFATVLAGCSDDASEENDNNSSDDDGSGDDGLNDSDGNESDDDSSDDSDEDDGPDEVPGFNKDKVDLEHTDVTVEHVKRDGYHVDIEATLKKTPKQNELEKIIEELGIVAAEAIEDPEAFLEAIETLEFTLLNKDGDTVLSFYIDVAWAVAYIRNNMSSEEFVHKTLATA
ncbi:hypothetical protein HALLA_16875 [Halostagnicola larsenii XH-48]|uniref:DUF8159 domain-containing protein n=1 Tax=Halostagnicola larsenii XH-48 TaxID=797299 RepID=W0JSN4_9EURY|nr:hypothetical protein [Halostagnicola larsenii]AHG00225.1 hypothetical protein HALLA_16875 [Halostagnicola larsenii XH-48]